MNLIKFRLLFILFFGLWPAVSPATENQLDSLGATEQIYQQPRDNIYAGAKICVLEFKSPEYATDSGKKAAEKVYKELLKKNLDKNIQTTLLFTHQKSLPPHKDGLLDFARRNQLDLIIIGEVQEFSKGGNYQNSRVCIEIRAIRPDSHGFQTQWHASSCETSHYKQGRDLIFFRIPGRPSAPSSELMEKIAVRFANMLTREPSVISPAPHNKKNAYQRIRHSK